MVLFRLKILESVLRSDVSIPGEDLYAVHKRTAYEFSLEMITSLCSYILYVAQSHVLVFARRFAVCVVTV